MYIATYNKDKIDGLKMLSREVFDNSITKIDETKLDDVLNIIWTRKSTFSGYGKKAERNIIIFKIRYGLLHNKIKNNKEISKDYMISEQRVCNIVSTTIKDLRQYYRKFIIG